MRDISHYLEDSGMIVGEAYQLEYSKHNGQWTLRHPSDRRRAWRDSSLLGLVETTLGVSLGYRYNVIGHDSKTLHQLQSRSFEGVLLAIAGRPTQVVIPPDLERDYSAQELAFARKWQELLVTGTASNKQVPIDAQSLSFKDALELISEAKGKDDE